MPPPSARLDDLPPEIRRSAGYLLHRCAGLSHRCVTEDLQPIGLEVKQFALLCTLHSLGARSQGWLGEYLGVDRTTMVQLVDGLEAKGYVERQRNPFDRRSYALTITPAGLEVWGRAKVEVERSENELLEGLDDEQRETLRDLLERVVLTHEAAALLPAPGDADPLPR